MNFRKLLKIFLYEKFPRLYFKLCYKIRGGGVIKGLISKNILIWGNVYLADEIERCYSIQIEKNKTQSLNKAKISRDIALCYVRYGITPTEYFEFNFHSKNACQRNEYLSIKHKDEALMKRYSDKYADIIYFLKNKYDFYLKANKYFKRDVCNVTSVLDKASFLEFARKHMSFFCKPLNGQCGNGARIEEITEYKTAEYIFNSLIKQGSWIVEEMISQHPSMAVWNPSSVNTIRMPSFIKNCKHYLLYPVLRTGRKGSIVDNGHAGGIFAVINADSGLVMTDGLDVNGNRYEYHPDSMKKFIGYEISQWESLKKLCEEIHLKVLKDIPYVGFDFALSKEGWVLIEANGAGSFDLCQCCLDKGIRKEFIYLFGK